MPSEQQHKIGRRGLVIAGTAAVAVIGGTGLAAYLHFKPSATAAPKLPPGPQKLIAGVPLLRLIKHTEAVNEALPIVEDLAWAHDGSMLAGIRDDFKLTIWQVKTGKVLQTLVLPEHTGNGAVVVRRGVVNWSPQAVNQLVTSNLLVANVWDAPANKMVHSLTTEDPVTLTRPKSTHGESYFEPEINRLAWSPDGHYLATASNDTTVIIWKMDGA